MTRTSFFDEAQSDVAQLHLARSEAQFATLAELMIDRWIESGEVAVARTFKAEYLTPPYNNWSITSSGIPGVIPNNNPMESWHRDLKRPNGIFTFDVCHICF